MNLTDWVVGNLKPYKLALNSPTRIGSFLPTIYGCVLPTLTPDVYLMFIAVKNGIKSPEIIEGKVRKSLKSLAIIAHYCDLQYYQIFPHNPKVLSPSLSMLRVTSPA